MFVPTFAAVLLTTAAVAHQQHAGETLRHIGSAAPSAMVEFASENAFIADVPGTTCPNCPANAFPPVTQVVSNAPIVLGTTTTVTPASVPTVANQVQTYSYYQINGRLYLVANPVAASTVTYSSPAVSQPAGYTYTTPVYSNGTTYYSTGANGQFPTSAPMMTFSSCPNGRCPNAR